MHYNKLDLSQLFKRLDVVSRLKPYFVRITSLAGRILLPIILLPVCLILDAAADDLFPRPPELEPDVAFWVAVFTEVDSDQGLLHDTRNLAAIYERIDIPAKASRTERQRRTQARRDHYRAILEKLAAGRRDNLGAEERRVLALWPEEVRNETLAEAAGNIRFQQGLSDRFRDGLVRAGRYRAHVHREFSKLGVPVGLAALPHVESSYNPEARSHVGASGIWQFTQSTGVRYMQIDHVLDERNDPYIATTAAGKLLAYNHSIAGNWPMAITAYNHGLAGVRRAMRAHGDEAYVDILRNYRGRTFGFASRNFYVAFLAALEVDQNPDRYFPGLVPDAPVAYEITVVGDYVAADTLADSLSVTVRDLARHNPALQASVRQGSKYIPRDFAIRLPAAGLQAPIADLVAALPADARFDRQLPDLFHTIVRGDTLSQIARSYDTSVSTLVALNNLGSSHRIRAGQRLRLPAAGPLPQPEAVAGETAEPTVEPPPGEPIEVMELPETPSPADLSELPALAATPEEETIEAGALADDRGSTITGALESSLLSDPSDYTVAGDGSIEVHPLETLGHFADWLGIRTQRLRDLNGLAFGTQVEVGQRIELDLSRVNAATFEGLRSAWHKEQQDAFFRDYKIAGVTEHVVERGESVWILALRRYDVPVWLFRQYNPELDLHNVRLGTRISFPVLVRNSG
jgi:membrane-bound lytic murein transglycosylase D